MRRFHLLGALILIVLAASPTFARHIWTDTDGDGLPDGGLGNQRSLALGETVLVDIWVDSEELVWNDFYLYIGWPQGCFFLHDAGFHMGEGGLFDGTYNDTLGLIDFGYSESGMDRIGWIKLIYDSPGACCTWPLYGDQPNTLRSFLRSQNTMYFFPAADSSCFFLEPPTATHPTTWGGIKGMYR